MAVQFNPLGISGPSWSGNAQQSDYRIPSVSANVASYALGADVLQLLLTKPAAKFAQPDTTARALTGTLTGPLGSSSKVVNADGSVKTV